MRLAVVGATGVVGEKILAVLDERGVPVNELAAFASRERVAPLRFRGRDVPIRRATAEALTAGRYDAVFFASSDDASAELAEHCVAAGAVVIDNSAMFRMDPAVPLIVPEVNAGALLPEHRIFPVANCTAIVLVMALAPIARMAGLRSVRVATYQAVSGAGRAGLEALASQENLGVANISGESMADQNAGLEAPAPQENLAAAKIFSESSTAGDPPGTVGVSPFVSPIFRNVVPQVGTLDELGDAGEEKKIAQETRKMLGLPDLHVAATAVRVPVRFAHSVAVFLETERDTTATELGEALATAPGLAFHPAGVVTPLDVEGQDLVHVARLRPEGDSKRHFQMWVVGDQLRKGAATNGVQILELLIARGHFARAQEALSH